MLGITSGAEEYVGSRGTDSNQTKQKPTRSGLKRQKGECVISRAHFVVIYYQRKLNCFSLHLDTSRSNLTSISQVCSGGGKTTGQKKALINVVLTEDEILPGWASFTSFIVYLQMLFLEAK